MKSRSWSLTLGGLLVAGRLWAGSVCQQDCTSGTCEQTGCGAVEGVLGYCGCETRAVVWSEGTYAAWCRASGLPTADKTCAAEPTAEEKENGTGLGFPGQPDLRLSDADQMLATVETQNPYVATLLGALVTDGSWVDGPFEGQLHDSHFDDEEGTLHAPALGLKGQVVAGGLGAAQIQISVVGDLRTLLFLDNHVQGFSEPILVPASVTGTVTDRGLHGSLIVTALSGQAESLQW